MVKKKLLIGMHVAGGATTRPGTMKDATSLIRNLRMLDESKPRPASRSVLASHGK
jgi:hypothetical protein